MGAVIPEEEIFAVLEKRRGVLDGVCVTGGEPTLDPDLERFVTKIKELGYLVKLDTNGYRPEILKKLVEEKKIDSSPWTSKTRRPGTARRRA